MNAWVLDEPKPVNERPLRLADRPDPAPGPDEVLIAVRACGICRTDLHVVEGELEVRRPGIVPGHQVVGCVEALGANARGLDIGQRVGVAWLHSTCGTCPHCRTARENLCTAAQFTGWTRDGGYAERLVAPAEFVYALPDALDDLAAAPLLCAGIIGYRCLRQCGLADWSGARLGLYGFGAAGHIAIQIALHRGAEVYVCTRDRARHQALAEELGATWVGDTFDTPPVALDASIVFAPAGEIVPAALRALDRGGRLVLGGIHMSPIPSLDYGDLYWEREIRTVANNTRDDGRAFLAEAARAGVHTHTQAFAFNEANEALIALKHDAIRGAGVLVVEAAGAGTE
ncbi:MAG: zinc-dependent alcohol dehydrogenase family protein [Planctomycetes bacterium]|nr:zinc-dependent alcohol dehydrogenase family protein [Planctomycetota bacterium]